MGINAKAINFSIGKTMICVIFRFYQKYEMIGVYFRHLNL